MQIKDLTPKEIMAVKEKATASVGINNRAYYGSGFNLAIKFAKNVEKCKCRCHNCKKPIVYPWDMGDNIDADTLKDFGIGIYGGDICGELSFCKECWSKLTDTDKRRLIRENFPNKY